MRSGAPPPADIASPSLTGVSALLALLSSLLWGSADFLGGILSRRLPAVLVVACSQFAGLLAVAAVAVGGRSPRRTDRLPALGDRRRA